MGVGAGFEISKGRKIVGPASGFDGGEDPGASLVRVGAGVSVSVGVGKTSVCVGVNVGAGNTTVSVGDCVTVGITCVSVRVGDGVVEGLGSVGDGVEEGSGSAGDGVVVKVAVYVAVNDSVPVTVGV
jgi:hypothetical protein